jgi:hypothetical protein
VTCSRDGGESAERIGIVPYDIVHGALGTSRRRLMNVRSSTLDATPNFRQIGHSNAVDQFAETYPGVSLGYNIRRHFDHCGGVGDSQATASEFEQCRVVFTSPIETTFPAGIPSSSRATVRRTSKAGDADGIPPKACCCGQRKSGSTAAVWAGAVNVRYAQNRSA